MPRKPKTTTLNIMFVDIVDYTKTTLRLDISSFERLHRIFDKMIKDMAKKHNGTIINKLGDAFLLTFKTPIDAVNCALTLQDAQLIYNKKSTSDIFFELRTSINKGIVLLHNKDVFGTSVNIAARINTFCRPGEIIITERIHDEIEDMYTKDITQFCRQFTIESAGKRRLKGLESPLQIYHITNSQLERLELKRLVKRTFSSDEKINMILLILIFTITIFVLIVEFLIPLL